MGPLLAVQHAYEKGHKVTAGTGNTGAVPYMQIQPAAQTVYWITWYDD